MENIAVVGTLGSANVLEELRPCRWLIERETLLDVDTFDWTKSLKEFSEHVVLPPVLIGNMMNRMLERHERMGFPARTGGPMKDHAVPGAIPLCTTDLFHLMLQDFVGPDPVDEIQKPR